MTRESLLDAGFKQGDKVEALIKAINVIFVNITKSNILFKEI